MDYGKWRLDVPFFLIIYFLADHKIRDVSFEKCKALRGITLVKRSMESPRHDLTGIVLSITSKYIQRITIGFTEQVLDAELQLAIKSKIWETFDEAIARLAERTLNNGRRLQVELHVCGNPSTELFDLIFPRLVEGGCLKVVKTSYIWKGSIPCNLSLSK